MSESSPSLSSRILSYFNLGSYELKKFIPLSFIMFCILFNYTILRDIKDVLINTLPGVNTELVPYIKGVFVVSCAFLFVIVYSKLASIIDTKKLFYYVTIVFLVFFTVFAFVIHPMEHYFHPSKELVDSLIESHPHFRFAFGIWGVWSYVLFYIMSELYGSAVLSLLFWQFANDIVTSEQAKRYYPLFGIVSNIALIFSGQVIKIFADVDFASEDPWGTTLKQLAMTVVIFCALKMVAHRWMLKNVLTDTKLCPPDAKSAKKPKHKLSMSEGFKQIFRSKYIGYIAIMVFSYGMCMNIVELVWKKQLAIRFCGDKNAYALFMGSVSQNTGFFVVAFILLTKKIIQKLGWFIGAVITPVVMLVTGFVFVMFVLFSGIDYINDILMGFGVSAVVVASYVGGLQNVLTKGCKYALFDPTKEMAYIPLDSDLKTRGKAAVDVVGARLGKAGGSYLWMGLFHLIPGGNIIVCAPYAIMILAVVILLWIITVKKLSKLYSANSSEKDA